MLLTAGLLIRSLRVFIFTPVAAFPLLIALNTLAI